MNLTNGWGEGFVGRSETCLCYDCEVLEEAHQGKDVTFWCGVVVVMMFIVMHTFRPLSLPHHGPHAGPGLASSHHSLTRQGLS